MSKNESIEEGCTYRDTNKNDKSQDDSGAIDMDEEEGVSKDKKSGGTGNIRGDSVMTEVDITEQTKTRTSKRKRNNKGE